MSFPGIGLRKKFELGTVRCKTSKKPQGQKICLLILAFGRWCLTSVTPLIISGEMSRRLHVNHSLETIPWAHKKTLGLVTLQRTLIVR